jgi:tetratricopeptide (TPR) repeat protein
VFPARRALRIPRDLARALDHAHARGVLHRDIKPSNVLLTSEGKPILIDFGLAGAAAGRGSLTQSGVFMGTPGYWPPEQAAGRLGEIGPTADVYSLGATLFELLCGQIVFVCSSLQEQLAATLDRAPPKPSSLCPGLDPRVDEVVLRCLAKDPADRYQSAGALAHALGALLRGPKDPPRGASRVPLVLTVVNLVIGLLVALAFLTGDLLDGEDPDPPARAEAEPEPPAPEPEPPAPEPEPLAPEPEPPSPEPKPPDPQAVAEAERCVQRAGRQLTRDREGALRELDQALALAPDLVSAHALRAIMFIYAGRDDEARVAAERALAGTGGTPQQRSQAHYVRGRLRAQAGDTAGALSDYDACLAVHPDNGQARFERGVIRAQRGDLPGGYVDTELARFLGLGPQDEADARQLLAGLAGEVTVEQRRMAYEALLDELPATEGRLRGWTREQLDRSAP